MAGTFLIGKHTEWTDCRPELHKENSATASHFSALSSPCQVLVRSWAICGHMSPLTQLRQAGWAKPHAAPSAQRRENAVGEGWHSCREKGPPTALMIRLSHKSQAASGSPRFSHSEALHVYIPAPPACSEDELTVVCPEPGTPAQAAALCTS